MKTLIEIKTNVYPDPLQTYAMRDEKDGVIYYKWCEQRTPDERESLYELILDTKAKKATVKRSGSIKSEMEFIAGEETFGGINTFYGMIPVRILTDYINMPSAVSEVFEMCYSLNSGENELVKNTFSLKRLLQNTNC